MARNATGWWNPSRKVYEARIGPASPKTGKPTVVTLRGLDGLPLPFLGDDPGEIEEVKEAIQRVKAEKDLPPPVNLASSLTLDELRVAYLDWHVATGSAPKTIKTHELGMRQFCEFKHAGVHYGKRLASSITLADLTRFRKDMEARGRETGTVRLRYMTILACWRWANRPVEDRTPERLLGFNPFDGVERPKRGEITDMVIDRGTARRIIRFSRSWIRRQAWWRESDHDQNRLMAFALCLLATTGARPQEILGLEWSQIDWRKNVIVLEIHKTSKRTRKTRVIALSRQSARALAWWSRQEKRHSRWVFSHRRSVRETPPNTREFSYWFRRVREGAIEAGLGIPDTITPYWFRHSWQTFGLEVQSVEGVAAAAGNSPTVLLNTYNHPRIKRISEVADSVNRAMREDENVSRERRNK